MQLDTDGFPDSVHFGLGNGADDVHQVWVDDLKQLLASFHGGARCGVRFHQDAGEGGNQIDESLVRTTSSGTDRFFELAQSFLCRFVAGHSHRFIAACFFEPFGGRCLGRQQTFRARAVPLRLGKLRFRLRHR